MKNKVYFASDFHLGIDAKLSSRDREHLLIKWLNEIEQDAQAIFLVGDVWDFYFEYKTVVPKGSVRLLGKLASLRDAGVELHFFRGNHDMWIFHYLEEELDIPIHDGNLELELQGKRILVGHGDGLGPGDRGYKILKKLFRNSIAQWVFRWMHPDIGIKLANFWSGTSRKSTSSARDDYHEAQEWLVRYCRERLQKEHFDYFIFGHRHLPIVYDFKQSQYINLGDWLEFQSYAVLENGILSLKSFQNPELQIFGNSDILKLNTGE
jgi:UDP-2,3-diacylglucosamine hydrolase